MLVVAARYKAIGAKSASTLFPQHLSLVVTVPITIAIQR
jgi:hypothetical protein